MGPEKTRPLPSCHGSAPVQVGAVGKAHTYPIFADLLDDLAVVIDGWKILYDHSLRLPGRKHWSEFTRRHSFTLHFAQAALPRETSGFDHHFQTAQRPKLRDRGLLHGRGS